MTESCPFLLPFFLYIMIGSLFMCLLIGIAYARVHRPTMLTHKVAVISIIIVWAIAFVASLTWESGNK